MNELAEELDIGPEVVEVVEANNGLTLVVLKAVLKADRCTLASLS